MIREPGLDVKVQPEEAAPVRPTEVRPTDAEQRRIALERSRECAYCREPDDTPGPRRPCLDGCGRQVTAQTSCAPGYCTVCAHDPRWATLG